MNRYNVLMILSVLIFAGFIYSQPPPEGMDCPEEDCIENLGDMPPGPPDMDGHPGMMKERKMERLSEEKIEKIMNYISAEFPGFHKRLIELKKDHPKVFIRAVHKLKRFARNDKKGPESKEKLLKIFSDEIELDLLVEKYNFEKNSKIREDIRNEMLKIMSLTFDKREEMKLEMIKNIEKNLEKKKAEAAKRKADKDKIISEDIEKILKFREKIDKEK